MGESNIMTIITAVLAGGILNQLFTTLFGDKIQFKRDFKRWRRIEKYAVYTEMIDLTSSSKPECGLDKWPSKIRSLSQKIYLLHKKGHPPQDLCDSLEDIFQLALKARKGEIKDKEFNASLRTISSLLRRRLAISLEQND
jgi:hypothetical protein